MGMPFRGLGKSSSFPLVRVIIILKIMFKPMPKAQNDDRTACKNRRFMGEKTRFFI